jgi:hypothetical protein
MLFLWAEGPGLGRPPLRCPIQVDYAGACDAGDAAGLDSIFCRPCRRGEMECCLSTNPGKYGLR